jgi:hypothetical protein
LRHSQADPLNEDIIMRPIDFLPVFALFACVAVHGNEIKVADRDTRGLIHALEQANRSPHVTTIQLAHHGLYTIDSPVEPEHFLGLPELKGNIVVKGNEAEIRGYSRFEFTLLGIARGANVTINALTLAEGSEGAILNRGNLQLNRVKVIDNVTHRRLAIIENYGKLRVTDSVISFNQLDGTQRDAGTMINFSTLRIDNSEISHNWISRRYDSLYAASAVLNLGRLSLSHVSIVENTAYCDASESTLGSVINLGVGTYTGIAVDINSNAPQASNHISAESTYSAL